MLEFSSWIALGQWRSQEFPVSYNKSNVEEYIAFENRCRELFGDSARSAAVRNKAVILNPNSSYTIVGMSFRFRTARDAVFAKLGS